MPLISKTVASSPYEVSDDERVVNEKKIIES